MKADFSLTLETNQSPQRVFQAVKNVREWWSGYYSEEIEGGTESLHDAFSFKAGDGAHSTKHQLVEVVPDRRIVWLTTESHLDFVDKTDEWTGTKVIFEISEKEGKTQLTFTHEGLTPQAECYEACAPAWTQYLENKLLPLINDPDLK